MTTLVLIEAFDLVFCERMFGKKFLNVPFKYGTKNHQHAKRKENKSRKAGKATIQDEHHA